MTNILRIDSAMRTNGSHTRAIADNLIDALQQRNGASVVTRRDLAQSPVPFVDEAWIGANFTDPDARTDDQRAVLAGSDTLVEEIEAADILVIGAPIYNFGIPAALKAWIDMIARARRTFRYTADGPEGLLKGKKTFVVTVSGGTKAGSEWDFATPYLRHVLGFVGLDDVTFITADGSAGQDGIRADAQRQIDAAIAMPEVAA
ncbi:MAG: NAD(P)H-dependent oxidoreductase [Pseudomonadota bacterium]